MSSDGNIPLARFRFLQRISASVPAIEDLEGEVRNSLSSLSLPSEKLRNRRIAVAVGSRGIANIREIARFVCGWLKEKGAQPFVFPAMGSHGGATAEGQRKILEDYGVTPEFTGAEIRATMEAVSLGLTPEGFEVYLDRNAWESDGVVVINRVKPHTDFSGKIESGLLKMMSVGMGKVEGASQVHRWGWRFGFETVLRTMAGRALESGKILCGLALVENELHGLCAVRAALPERVVSMEEQALAMARPLVPRIPFSRLHLLIVDELGKNISGAGMDTKIIGRGVEFRPGEAPDISQIYVRDLTRESEGNAVGVGFADVIHERLFRKIDFEKMYINTRTALNPPAARLPIHLRSDQDALRLALGHLGSPEPEEQRVAWIRNTLDLARIAISERLAAEAPSLDGWRLTDEFFSPQFDPEGNCRSPL